MLKSQHKYTPSLKSEHRPPELQVKGSNASDTKPMTTNSVHSPISGKPISSKVPSKFPKIKTDVPPLDLKSP
jgi:hypothetical protein